MVVSPQELIERVKSYDVQLDEEILLRAYDYAQKLHSKQLRASGDPYFHHPLEVAMILAEMRLDAASIITALLHDTVEDTEATLEDIKKNFGPSIAELVDGVTKLTRLEHQTDSSNQAENLRKLVLAMSKDIRVLLVKLADRLHNMRTINFISNPDKRARIARETLEIYAPLAERIGIQKMKDELQDIAFKELFPDARDSILHRLAFLSEQNGDLIDQIIVELEKALKREGLKNFIVKGRQKTPYSMWLKMQKKNITFEQLSDVIAFRLIVDNIEGCYQALGILHSQFQMVPGRFKDYISTPKKNGYRSIHTCIIGPLQKRIEVQIRSYDMHEVAELGVAAHWIYKQRFDNKKGHEYSWLREILEILENAQKPEEFLEHTKLELFQDHVFCFSPKGDLIELPQGATPVDFAYAVHSELGDRCVGTRINGKMMPLRTILQNGDEVEIITSKTQMPSPSWERFVVTGKAKARIRKFVRSQQRDQYVNLGKAMLQKLFRAGGYDFTEKAVENVLKKLVIDNNEEVYNRIGSGLLTAHEVFKVIFPGHKTEKEDLHIEMDRENHAILTGKNVSLQIDQGTIQPKATKEKSSGKGLASREVDKNKAKRDSIVLKGLIPGLAVHFAKCCHPLPGDRIVGIVTTGKGVTIHTIDCETLENYSSSPERWIDVDWDRESSELKGFVGRIMINVANEIGGLGTVSTIIGKNGGNITNLKIVSRNVDYFEFIIDLLVPDNKVLNNIIAALRATPIINSVERVRGA